jgi:hypothetical protein
VKATPRRLLGGVEDQELNRHLLLKIKEERASHDPDPDPSVEAEVFMKEVKKEGGGVLRPRRKSSRSSTKDSKNNIDMNNNAESTTGSSTSSTRSKNIEAESMLAGSETSEASQVEEPCPFMQLLFRPLSPPRVDLRSLFLPLNHKQVIIAERWTADGKHEIITAD